MKFRIFSLLLVICMLFCVVGCSDDKKNDENSKEKTTEKNNVNVHEHSFSDATCLEPQKCSCGEIKGEAQGHNIVENKCIRCGFAEILSDKCDKILAVGIDGDNKYELVANESEDYNGVIVEVGVIKNNEWLIKPTTDSPFVDEDKTLRGTDVGGIDTVPETIYYIGNGCFYYKYLYNYSHHEDVVFNVENQKFKKSRVWGYNYTTPAYIAYNDNAIISKDNYELHGEKAIISNSEYVIWEASDGEDSLELVLLNVISMETKTIHIADHWTTSFINPISDNVFALVNYNGLFIYDTNGKLVLDLSKYKLTHYDQPIFFMDGKCTFTIFNNNENIYKITIDKEGNVLDSEQK